MNTKQIGDTSESLVLAELTRRGYQVAVRFGDNDRYDLVVDDGDTLHRVQVKTGWREDGCIRFKTGSRITTDGRPTVEDYTADEVDAFAVSVGSPTDYSGSRSRTPVEKAPTSGSRMRPSTTRASDTPSGTRST